MVCLERFIKKIIEERLRIQKEIKNLLTIKQEKNIQMKIHLNLKNTGKALT